MRRCASALVLFLCSAYLFGADYVATRNVNLREHSTTSSKIIRVIKKGEKLSTIGKKRNGFLHVEAALDQRQGWVYAAYAKPAQGTTTTGTTGTTTTTTPTTTTTTTTLNPAFHPPAGCPASIEAGASTPFTAVNLPPQAGSCQTRESNGFVLPDPNCTPGAINPTLTLDMLTDADYRTGCVRNAVTSESQKNATYAWYGIQHPQHNQGQTQTCELDHLVPLYLGGADTVDNLWPQCGPDGVTLNERYFKQKDKVECYLGNMVRKGQMQLADAQHGIATDWTQYLDAANADPQMSNCFSGNP